MRIWLAIFTLGVLACAARGPSLPNCPITEKMQPPPSASCRSDLGFIAFESELSALIEDADSPLRVRVEFDSRSMISGICADRTSLRATQRIQREMFDRTKTVASRPPGPPCVANSRLDFNWQGVENAAVKAISRECQRQDPSPRALVDCLEYNQRRKQQVWIFDQLLGTNRVYVFYKTPNAIKREIAVNRCARDQKVSNFANYSIPVARGGNELNDCMHSQGWTSVPTH